MESDAVADLLGRLDERTQHLAKQLDDFILAHDRACEACHTDVKRSQSGLEKRVRRLEVWQWKAVGGAAVSGIVFGALAGYALGLVF